MNSIRKNSKRDSRTLSKSIRLSLATLLEIFCFLKMSKWMKLAYWHVFQKSKQILFSLASSKDYKLLVPKYLSWNGSTARKCWQEYNTTTSKGSTTSCFRLRKTMKSTITTISIIKYQFWTPTGTTKQTKKWNSKSTPTGHTSHYWSCWEGERTDSSN